MLQPKRRKYRKEQKGRNTGKQLAVVLLLSVISVLKRWVVED